MKPLYWGFFFCLYKYINFIIRGLNGGASMVDMVKIIHNNYEKISDDLFWLSNRWVLKFNVKLNKYSDKYGRTNYHKEINQVIKRRYYSFYDRSTTIIHIRFYMPCNNS